MKVIAFVIITRNPINTKNPNKYKKTPVGRVFLNPVNNELSLNYLMDALLSGNMPVPHGPDNPAFIVQKYFLCT